MRRARAVLMAAAAVLAGYLVAHALLGGGRNASPSSAATPTSTGTAPVGSALRSDPGAEGAEGSGPGPRRVAAGVPVGFARSERGAVAAAGNYLTTFSRALTPAAPFSWDRAVRALTVAPLTARAMSGSVASAMMSRRFARSGSSFYLGSWLLGYRVLAYSPTRARVALWSVGVMSSTAGVVPPDFSTTTCELRWVERDWKVSDARVSEGPTPPSSPATGAAQAVAFAAAARRFSSYRDVP